jgi:uncharacterized protein (TIGR04222 family)
VRPYAADTWGISGPTFLVGYLVLAAVLIAGAVLWRRAITAGPSGVVMREPHAQELAQLSGGDQLARYAAQAALRTAGAIDAAGHGVLRASGPMPVGAGELEYAIYNAVVRGANQRSIAADPGVRAALQRQRDNLTREGWLLDRAAQLRARAGGLVVLAWAAFGGWRVQAGSENHKPVMFITLAAVATALIGLRLLTAPRTSRAANRLLKRLRRGNAHLAPRNTPAWATYGGAGAALGVALFGAAALWAADPAFAASAEIQRQATSAGGGESGAGGASGCGSSGCGGGGGCGGGCGG